MTVSGRDNKRVSTYSRDDIPETVTIGVLSKDYEPSKMPHGKIVETLLEKQRNSRMAATFHTNEATLCQGCHHNSPPSKTPPKCVSCHGVDMQPSANSLLSLKAAYHQQCITCHERMNQKPLATECADCHKPRGN
jgi:DnaJ-class molecular chaperone